MRRERLASMTYAARSLRLFAAEAANAYELPTIRDIRGGLLVAAGYTWESAAALSEEDEQKAVRSLIEDCLQHAGSAFRDVLVSRFLDTCRREVDASMEKVDVEIAKRRFAAALAPAVHLAHGRYDLLHGGYGKWTRGKPDDPRPAHALAGISWATEGGARTLLFDLFVPPIGHRVGVSLLRCSRRELTRVDYGDIALYVALGEINGRIDSVGFDSHWKTAKSALHAIRETFASRGLFPHTFFAGSGMTTNAAHEIWRELENGALDNAANLTNSDQTCLLACWLAHL